MGTKGCSNSILILILAGLLIFGLTSCRLAASNGPQTGTSTSDGFPVPGEGDKTSGTIDISAIATQTAQALPPGVVDTALPTTNPTVGESPQPTSIPPTPESPTAPIVYVTATPGGPPATYTLQEGEYPFCIARRFNVNAGELLSLNGLTANSYFYAGLELQIPQTGNPFDGERALKEHPTTYKIQAGDTLNSIACSFGDVSPDMIALQNNLTSPDLPVGEVLIIP